MTFDSLFEEYENTSLKEAEEKELAYYDQRPVIATLDNRLDFTGKFVNTSPVTSKLDMAKSELYQDACNEAFNAACFSANRVLVKEFEIKNQALWYLGAKVANFYYEVLKVAVVLDGNNSEEYSGYLMKVKVHVFQGGRERVQILTNVSKEQLESTELLRKVPFAVSDAGILKSDFKNIMYHYSNFLISNYSGDIEYIAPSTGWFCIDGKSVYVDNEKALGHPELSVHAMSERCIRNNRNVGNLWMEFQNMRKVLNDRSQMTTLLTYVLLSYLFTLFQEVEQTLKHTMFFVGARGSRKTALALCFTQLEHKESPQFNFLATESGIQAHLKNYHDSVLFVDDLAPSTDPANRRRTHKMLETIVRLFGDATERVINKNFAKGAAKYMDYSVKGGAVLTGEYFYSTGTESSIARAVVLELQSDSVDLKRLTYYQKHPEILETLIFRYLVYVSKNWSKCKETIVSVVDQYRIRYQNKFSNGRYADYIGQYMANTYILTQFFKEESGITFDQEEVFLAEAEEDFLKLLTVNDHKMQKRAPVTTLALSLANMVEIDRVLLWGNQLPPDMAVLLETEDAYYVRQKDLPEILKLYCSRTGEPYLKMTSQELGRLLEQAGLCTVYLEGVEKRLTKKYPKDYGSTRLMELPKAKLNVKVEIHDNK